MNEYTEFHTHSIFLADCFKLKFHTLYLSDWLLQAQVSYTLSLWLTALILEFYNVFAIIRDCWCYDLLIIETCCCLQLLSNNQINKCIKFHLYFIFLADCSYSWILSLLWYSCNYKELLILWSLNQDSDSLILNIIFQCWVCRKMRLCSW